MGAKRLTLADVRRNPKLLARFIKQHPSEADGERFEKVLGEMAKPIKKPAQDDQT